MNQVWTTWLERDWTRRLPKKNGKTVSAKKWAQRKTYIPRRYGRHNRCNRGHYRHNADIVLYRSPFGAPSKEPYI